MDVASALVGKEIWVSWPHMIEAKVVSVCNAEVKKLILAHVTNRLSALTLRSLLVT